MSPCLSGHISGDSVPWNNRYVASEPLENPNPLPSTSLGLHCWSTNSGDTVLLIILSLILYLLTRFFTIYISSSFWTRYLFKKHFFVKIHSYSTSRIATVFKNFIKFTLFVPFGTKEFIQFTQLREEKFSITIAMPSDMFINAPPNEARYFAESDGLMKLLLVSIFFLTE